MGFQFKAFVLDVVLEGMPIGLEVIGLGPLLSELELQCLNLCLELQDCPVG